MTVNDADTDTHEEVKPSKGRVLVRYAVAILVFLALVGLLAAVKGAQIGQLISFGEEMKKSGPPPEAVGSARVKEDKWGARLRAVGNVVSEKGVVLTNEVAGLVKTLRFESGDVVKKGQTLVILDAGVERAQLASTAARRELAETSAKRSEALVKSGAISKERSDADVSSVKELSAEERSLSAQINRKVIRAPFAGKLGIRQINLGQYLSPGTPIATLESISDTLFVDFSLPQQHLNQVALGVKVQVTPEQNEASTAETDATRFVEGEVTAIDPKIDAQSRTFHVRASLSDAKQLLRSGMFVNVEVLLPSQSAVLLVPVTAVVRAPYGDSVYVVEKDKKSSKLVARQQFVKLGDMRGDFIAVQKGLNADAEVVSAGAFKLHNGVPIVINNDIKTDPKLNPKLDNR